MDVPAKLDQHGLSDQEDLQPPENEVPNNEESEVDIVDNVDENETQSERKIEIHYDLLRVLPWVNDASVEGETKNDLVKETETKNDPVKEKEKGNSFVKCSKWQDAIEAYSRAITWDPAYTTCYANRAQCYLKIRWFQQAIRDCTIAITLDENYIKAYARRAIAYINLDKKEDAVNDLEKVLTIEPENQECKKLLEKLLNNTDQKIKDSMSEKEQKNYANELKEKAKLCLEENKLVDAINYYSEARVYSEFDPIILFNRAVCYFKLRRFKHAWLDCTTAIDLNENYVKAYYWRGKAKAMCNKFEAAREDLLKGLQLEPENKTLKKMLETVESYEQKFNEERKKEPVKKSDYREEYGLLRRLKNLKKHDKEMKDIEKHLETDSNAYGNSNYIDVQYFESHNQSFQHGDKQAFERKPETSFLRIGQYILPVPLTFDKFAKGWNLLEFYRYRRLVYFLQIDAEQLPMKFNELCSNPSWLYEIMELMVKHRDCRSRLRFYDHLIGISLLEEFKKVFIDCSKEDKENVRKILASVAVKETNKDIQQLEEIYSCVLNSS